MPARPPRRWIDWKPPGSCVGFAPPACARDARPNAGRSIQRPCRNEEPPKIPEIPIIPEMPTMPGRRRVLAGAHGEESMTKEPGGSVRDRVAYIPIHKRPRLQLPGGARVAVWTIVNVE